MSAEVLKAWYDELPQAQVGRRTIDNATGDGPFPKKWQVWFESSAGRSYPARLRFVPPRDAWAEHGTRWPGTADSKFIVWDDIMTLPGNYRDAFMRLFVLLPVEQDTRVFVRIPSCGYVDDDQWIHLEEQ